MSRQYGEQFFDFMFSWISFLLLIGLFTGCSVKDNSENNDFGEIVEKMEWIHLRVELIEEIDSAQMLFFRSLAQRDTLFWQTMVYRAAAGKPNDYRLQLPAGKYAVWVFGNIPTKCMVANSPYTSNDIRFDYSRGLAPSAVYYGRKEIQTGVDSAITMGMLLLSSAVGLSINNIPEEVEQTMVQLLNTSAGLTLNNGYMQETMTPPLSQVFRRTEGESSYRAAFYCFPHAGKNDSCCLEVTCLDIAERIVYTGKSIRFPPRPGESYQLTCIFDNKPKDGQRNSEGNIHIGDLKKE